MKFSTLVAGLGSLAVVGTACAALTGLAKNESKITVNGVECCVVDIYATFSTDADVLLNIFNANITVEGGFGIFKHNDFVPGGTWGPQFNAGAGDSFLLIGGTAGFNNSTTADPNWGPAGFNQVDIPANAGWFNNNPPNLQGKAAAVSLVDKLGNSTYVGAATWIGRFVFVNDQDDGREFTFNGSATWNQGLGTPGQQGGFEFSDTLCVIPAPGAIALLGLAGLTGGRRRRA